MSDTNWISALVEVPDTDRQVLCLWTGAGRMFIGRYTPVPNSLIGKRGKWSDEELEYVEVDFWCELPEWPAL